MKNLLDKIFPTLSDELIIVISLIIGLLVTASLILFLVKKISPKTNISELAARTRSWWIMAGMFIGAVFISYNISYFFLAFLSFIAFRELYSVLGFREADRGALFWGILAIPIQYYLAYLAWYGAFIIFIPVVMFLVLPLRLTRNHQVDGTVAMDSDAFGIRYQPPRLSPVTSRTTGIQFRRTGSAVVPCIPYGNQ
jgi:phosphatidate cytidylyltransferase